MKIYTPRISPEFRAWRLARPSLGFLRLLWLSPYDLIAAASRLVLDVRGVVFLDHLNAGAAVLGDLVDVRTFHQAQADIGVAEAVSGARLALTVDFRFSSSRIALKSSCGHFGKRRSVGSGLRDFSFGSLPSRLVVRRRRTALQSLKRAHGSGHALAIADAALAADLDFKDRFDWWLHPRRFSRRGIEGGAPRRAAGRYWPRTGRSREAVRIPI